MTDYKYKEIAEKIIGAGMKVHAAPGITEYTFPVNQ